MTDKYIFYSQYGSSPARRLPVTLIVQQPFIKRGWHRWLAILRRKPVVEWRDVTTEIEDQEEE